MTALRETIKGSLYPLAVLLLLFAVHMYFIVRYGINIPFSDDYNEILKNVVQILDAGSFSEKAQNIMHGTGYSKPVTLRLISLLHLSTLQEINFKYLVITGNIFLLPVGLVYAIATAPINKLLTITAACFIFQPQYWEAIYQSTLSNSVFSCLFFSLASIWCFTRRKNGYYAAALILAVPAQLSFGNGFLVYPILFMIAVIHKKPMPAIAVVIQSLVSTWLYMFGSTVSYASGQQSGLLTQIRMCSVWLLEFVGSSLGYAFTSGYERAVAGRSASIIIGSLVLAFYLFIIIKKYYRRNLLLFSFMTFFILTALLAAKLRVTTEVPGASRYQIQSALCILTALIITIDLYGRHLNRYIIILLTVVLPLCFTVASYKTNLPVVSWHKSRLASGMWNWMSYGSGLTIWVGEEAAGRLLRHCSERNIYRMPAKESLMAIAWNP